jgi:hypothetical protein
MSLSFFTKLENGRQNRSCLGGAGTSGRREKVGKGYGSMNIVQILCKHVCKWKNDTFETIPGMGGEG